MYRQLTILSESQQKKQNLQVERKIAEAGKDKHSKEYCLNQIETEMYLWDMRCWDKYHDKKEVMDWLKKLRSGKSDSKNCGHVEFCIKKLQRIYQITDEVIAESILKNDKIQFKNRITKCWYNPKKCPKFKKQGHYGNDICKECDT